jgi:hypothetical protein
MPRLPHLDRAVVLKAKIVNYLLSARHSGGRAKARFLESFGFHAHDWRMLRDAVIAHATTNEITASHQTASASDMTSMVRCRRLTVVPSGTFGMVCGAAGKRTALGDVDTAKDWHVIDEMDLVVLKRDLPKERLAAGDVGTVVLVHQQGAGYEVEFTTLSGDTVAVVTLDATDVRPVESREIVHARAVN